MNYAQAIRTSFLTELIKVLQLMSLPLQMRIIYNVKHCYPIHLKIGENLLPSLTKLVLLEAKAIICPTIKENLLLYCL